MAERYEGVSLLGAKAWLEQRLHKGVKCPCCNQFTKMYHRPMNGNMIRALLNLYRAGGEDAFKFAHWPPIDPSKGDAAKLVHWGFIEEENRVREDGGRAGYWRVTEKGEDFLKGRIKVPSHIYHFDSKFYGFDDTVFVTVHDAWGEPFDLRKLMGE